MAMKKKGNANGGKKRMMKAKGGMGKRMMKSKGGAMGGKRRMMNKGGAVGGKVSSKMIKGPYS